MRYKSQALQRANGSKINADVAHYVYCRLSFRHIAANLWHFFPSWLVSNCKFVELGNAWSIEYTEQNMGAQAQMQLNRSKNKECYHHNHIKATMLTEQEEEEEGKKLSNDECFVNRMEHHDGNDEENIMSKEVWNACK